jgi:methanogenic corrinoid protein MtbC1
MAQVGKLYEEGEIFVPEMLVAARAMTAALTVLKPHVVEEGVASGGNVAIGTTQGDLHDIGKSLVAMMLEGSGYEIVDLGVAGTRGVSSATVASTSRAQGTCQEVRPPSWCPPGSWPCASLRWVVLRAV